jgi:pyrroline-5-carboxylate reductase
MYRVGIIGMGRLGQSVAQMLTSNGKTVCGSYRSLERKHLLLEKFGTSLTVTNDLSHIVQSSNYIVIATKPTQVREVCYTINPFLCANSVVVSTAAAVPLSKLHEWLPSTKKIIRCMPNIPCSIGQGVVTYHSLYSRSGNVMADIFGGNTIMRLNNNDAMDASTIISGCGPAFFSWFGSCMKTAGSDSLDHDQLHRLLVRTMKGTAAYLEHNTFGQVIDGVASPRGATEAALTSLYGAGVDIQLQEALITAAKRIRHLRDSFDE